MSVTGSRDFILRRDAERLAAALHLSARDARNEAELLLIQALGVTRARLAAHPELAAEAQHNLHYRQWLGRRLAGEPIAYILGAREFRGLEFAVSPAVLIPRPETELLVELALERIPLHAPSRVLDIGTGSGCIAISIAHARPKAQVVATDISESALAVAMSNAARHATAKVEFRLGSGFQPVAGDVFDLIVSNPPYVAADDPHLVRGDLRFEPKQALTSGDKGLAALRDIVADAPVQLRSDGWLLLEHGHDQAQAVRRMLLEAEFAQVFSERDLAGIPRVAGGRRERPGPAGG